MRKLKCIILTLLIFGSTWGLPGQNKQKEGELAYEVNVSAQIVPIYAVDKNGNPIFDLTQDELSLYADDKPMEVIYFNGYRVEEQQREKVSAPAEDQGIPTKPAAVKSPERLNFIIIDSLVSNMDVLALSQGIALGIIQNAPPGDAFIIMESNQIRGFQYIIGPEKDKVKLAQAVAQIEKLYMNRRFEIDPGTLHELQISSGNQREIVNNILRMDQDTINDNQWEYSKEIRILAQAIESLKYALKTITLPKTVFLITANPQKSNLKGLPVTYYQFLEKAAKEVNLGGGMFYLINPLTYRSEKMRTEMKFMTDAGNGKLIHGTNVHEIIEKVKKSTSAYYEVAFYSNKKPGEKSRISLKCIRKDVELISIGYSEQARPYHMMDTTEKKLFALDIINGGNWSRIVAKVGRIKYRLFSKNDPQNLGKTIEISIPPAMQNKSLELVTACINPETQEAAFERTEKSMGEKETIEITSMPGRNSYFIIIEPKAPLCIYNRVED